MRTMEADIVIFGGGPAGLAAAVTAGENDKKAIIFEKTNTTGGAANMGMGPLAIDTKIQKLCFNEITVDEAFKIQMEYTHFRVNGKLVKTYFEKSGETIEWLQDMGVQFVGAFPYFKESAATWHVVKPDGSDVPGPRAASAMNRIMTEKALELGAEICLETPGKKILFEDNKVVGAVAVDKNGEEIQVKCDAVIVCTGGFGVNKEMIKQEFDLNLWEDFHPFNVPGVDGEGLQMMWDLGAEKYGANIEAIYQLKDNMNWFFLDTVFKQPNLFINQEGHRFFNEQYCGNTTFTGNAIRQQTGNYCYSILDGAILKKYKKNGPDIFDFVHPRDAFLEVEKDCERAKAEGYDGYFEADTIEDLAKQMGIDPEVLEETIEDYNDMCEAGYDSEFGKKHEFLKPITGKGKYMAVRLYLASYGTIGGVRINEKCEVLRKDGSKIEGLYSCGSDANTIYGDSYNFTLPGNTMGFAVNSGRMAGEAAAEFLD